jgi:hypothetical protein
MMLLKRGVLFDVLAIWDYDLLHLSNWLIYSSIDDILME